MDADHVIAYLRSQIVLQTSVWLEPAAAALLVAEIDRLRAELATAKMAGNPQTGVDSE